MRRILLFLLALACLVLLAWRLGTGRWPGVPAGDPSHDQGDESEAGETLLRGREAGAPPAPTSPPVPDPPPTWPYGMLTGRVVGLDGTPLPNSGASVVGDIGPYAQAKRYRDAPADEDGRFELHVQADLPSVVVAGAMGHGVVVGPRVQLAEGETRDIGALRLRPEGRLPVRVVTDAGTPVADVDVTLSSETDPQPEGWEAALEASELLAARLTGTDGRVLFDMLPAGTWRVSIDTGGTRTCDQVREHVETNGEEVVFVLPSAAAPDVVRVQLDVRGPDGLPVPRANVTLAAAGCSESGPYDAAVREPLELECAVGPVLLIVEGALDAEGQPLGHAPVVVPDVRGLAQPVVVRMERGLTITGRVRWNGEPTTWRVRASGWLDADRDTCVPADESEGDWALLGVETQTEADGSFCLVGVPRGRLTVVASGPGRLRGRAPVVAAGATDVLLDMVPEGRLEVHVLAPTGQQFGSPYLAVEEWVDEGLVSRGSWFGGGGDRPDVRIFHADGLRLDARYRLTAWGDCSGGKCPARVLDGVVPREAPYVLQLADAPHVRGVVERVDGTPVWGIRVCHRAWPGGEFASNQFGGGPWPAFAVTDAAGAFDLSGLGEEEIVLGVSGLGLALRDAHPSVLPGASGVRLVVVPARRISGRVADPEGGLLDGLTVTAVPDQGAPGLWTPRRVMADGFFEVPALAPGTYRILVWNDRDPSDARSARSQPVPAGERDVRLELGTGAVVEGTVRDPAGRPVPGAHLHLLGRWTNRAAQTDGGGRYRFTAVPRDIDLDLEITPPRGRSTLRALRATATEAPTTLDVTLPKR